MIKRVFAIFSLVALVVLSFGVTDALAATSCTAGHYLDGRTCKLCPAGSISQGGTVTSCTPCKDGEYTTADRKACKACPAGSYCENGQKTTCPKGYYCLGGKNPKKICDANTYNTSTGQSSCDKVCSGARQIVRDDHTGCVSCNMKEAANETHTACEVKCQPGEYAKGKECPKCEEGYYCPDGKGRRNCKNGFTSKVGATQENQCKVCNAGTYEISGKCIDCPAGSYCKDGVKKTCSKGFFCPAKSGTATQCPGNTYNTANGQSSCNKKCDGDREIVNADHTGCTTCKNDEVPNSTHTACENCRAGFYPDGKVCSKCPAGYSCPDGKKRVKCGVGSVASADQKSCQVCPAGQYEDSNECKACPAGSYCKAGKKTTCSKNAYCPAGAKESQACPANATCDSKSFSCMTGYTKNAAGTGCVASASSASTNCPVPTQESCAIDKDVTDSKTGCVTKKKITCSGNTPECNKTTGRCEATQSTTPSTPSTPATPACTPCLDGQRCGPSSEGTCYNGYCVIYQSSCENPAGGAVDLPEVLPTCVAGEYLQDGNCHKCLAGFYCKGGVMRKCETGMCSESGASSCGKCPDVPAGGNVR